MAEDAVATGAARRERLTQRRKALGLTQRDLAGLLGVERSTVVRWERGETQPLRWIRPRLARALRVPAERLDELLAGAGAAAGPDAGGGPAGPAGPGAAATPGRDAVPVVPRQLPSTVPGFTGRAAELKALTRILDEAHGGAPGTVVISAIGGTAGVGKTALALHWAHQVAGRFGDGQLYVNLRGFDPSGIPASPTDAMCGFLDALGVPADKIPPRPEAQAAMYRGLVADRKMLIVLDNARDEQQVRPLLPASPASLVLVTSRNQLAGLASADGARLVILDVLTEAEAIQLLSSRVGVSRAAAEPDAVREIAGLCACLPLALAVAAARAIARPRFPLAGVAGELRDAEGRLDALDGGDPAASVRAVFSWSYRQLSPEASRVFRLLGVHPGPDISVAAAASLAATDLPGTRRTFRELTRAHLITERVPGRYALHDLLRAYAASQAGSSEPGHERQAAIGRVLDHYLHTAARAAPLVNPAREPITVAPPGPGTAPERFAAQLPALTWFESEHQALLAAVSLADSNGFDVHAWQIPWAMVPYLQTRGHYQERAAILRTALAAAARLGDPAAQAVASRLLASAYSDLGDYDQAPGYYMTSLTLYRGLGNRLGEAKVHQSLAVLAGRHGHYADALGHAEQALRLYEAIGDKAREADLRNDVGWYHALLGDYQRARTFCRQALALNAEADNRRLDGYIWDSRGFAEHHLGNLGEAAACYQRALDIFRDIGDRFNQAETLTNLGETYRARGESARVRESWRQALAILDDLGHPGAGKVRAKLDGLDGEDPDPGEPAAP
jgi:tetratricopeptide (TPR) repeat protein/DNA-binding XRE family transcriptional regulator